MLSKYTLKTVMLTLLASEALAGPREQANRIHNRIAGVPPTATVLDSMTSAISSGNPKQAVTIAMEDSDFYNVSLKNWITPWTNEEQSASQPLNDFTATAIGMIRDDIPFNNILFGNIIYTGSDSLVASNPQVFPLANNNNNHYESLENQRIDLKNNLVQKTQTSVYSSVPQTAGVMTSRAFGSAYLHMGTNRAAIRFTLMNFLCHDMEQMSDVTRPDNRVRKDVDRSPGGNSSTYNNKCKGCHSGMDGLAGAFAYFDFKEGNNGKEDGFVEYTAGNVQAKYSQNSGIFPLGFSTTNDEWINHWTVGQNAIHGWSGTQGNGVTSLGSLLAGTVSFKKCMAKRVYEKTCLKEVDFEDAVVSELAAKFENSGYKMKELFAESMVKCMGE